MMKLLLLIYAFLVVYAFAQFRSTFNNIQVQRFNNDFGIGLERALAPLNNLGEEISRSVQKSLQPLEGLGWRIDQAVNRVFKVDNMRNGVKGTTIVDTNDGQIILRNRQVFECLGSINSNGECEGNLKQLAFGEGKSICFPDRYTMINDDICISKNTENSGYMSVESVNGRVSCVGTNVKMLKRKDYEAICDRKNFRYKYIASQDNPDRALLPNNMSDVSCTNVQPVGVCEFN